MKFELTKTRLKYIMNIDHTYLNDEDILRLAKKEIKAIQEHYQIKKKKIKHWYKFRKEIFIDYFTVIDGLKIKNKNVVWLWSDGNGGIEVSQRTWSRTYDEKVFFNLTYVSMDKGYSARTVVQFALCENKYKIYICSETTYSIKKIQLRHKTIYNNTSDKYKKLVYEEALRRRIYTLDTNISPIVEMAAKEKWLHHLVRHGDIWAKKPLTAFSKYWTSGEKKEFSLWFAMIKKLKSSYDHRVWLDYRSMCRRRNINDYYNINYKKIHDEWNWEIAKQTEKRIQEFEKSFSKVFNSKKINLKVRKAKNRKELISLGEEISICVGTSDRYKVKDIWIATVNKTKKICIEYKNKKFMQISSYNNMKVPLKITKIIKQQILLKAN